MLVISVFQCGSVVNHQNYLTNLASISNSRTIGIVMFCAPLAVIVPSPVPVVFDCMKMPFLYAKYQTTEPSISA